MFGLNILRARFLSRRGEHAAALAMCDMEDVYVLSRAGMHLSVLEMTDKPSIERALALARSGQTAAAIEMARRYANRPAARTLLGYLATLEPESIKPITENRSGLENVSAYCHYATGEPASTEAQLEKISPLHGMVLALKTGRTERAKERYRAFFAVCGLEAPEVDWLPGGLNYDTLESRGSGADERLHKPLISVVLTAHNEERHLASAVNSLRAQSWRNLEIVIVNDASTDGTQLVAERLAATDERIRVITLDQNIGLWGAKNAGLQHCRGDIITMHDADDWSHHRKLELQVEPLIRDGKLQATSSYMVRIDQDTGVPYTRNARNYLRWNPSSFMFRASLIEDCGGFADKLLGSDCEFIARIETRSGARSHQHVRLPLSIGLQRGGSLSNRFRSGSEGLVRLQHWEQWRRQHAAGNLRGPVLDRKVKRGVQ